MSIRIVANQAQLSGPEHFGAVEWGHNKAAPRRCVNTVDPRGLADWIGVD